MDKLISRYNWSAIFSVVLLTVFLGGGSIFMVKAYHELNPQFTVKTNVVIPKDLEWEEDTRFKILEKNEMSLKTFMHGAYYYILVNKKSGKRYIVWHSNRGTGISEFQDI